MLKGEKGSSLPLARNDPVVCDLLSQGTLLRENMKHSFTPTSNSSCWSGGVVLRSFFWLSSPALHPMHLILGFFSPMVGRRDLFLVRHCIDLSCHLICPIDRGSWRGIGDHWRS